MNHSRREAEDAFAPRAEHDATSNGEPHRLAEDCIFAGRLEEVQGHWAAAAKLFERAFQACPGALSAAHAAENWRRAHLDLHKAARYAEYAAAREPRCAEFQLLLGLIYRDAGLPLRARSKFEQARRLSPGDKRCQAALDELAHHRSHRGP